MADSELGIAECESMVDESEVAGWESEIADGELWLVSLSVASFCSGLELISTLSVNSWPFDAS